MNPNSIFEFPIPETFREIPFAEPLGKDRTHAIERARAMIRNVPNDELLAMMALFIPVPHLHENLKREYLEACYGEMELRNFVGEEVIDDAISYYHLFLYEDAKYENVDPDRYRFLGDSVKPLVTISETTADTHCYINGQFDPRLSRDAKEGLYHACAAEHVEKPIEAFLDPLDDLSVYPPKFQATEPMVECEKVSIIILSGRNIFHWDGDVSLLWNVMPYKRHSVWAKSTQDYEILCRCYPHLDFGMVARCDECASHFHVFYSAESKMWYFSAFVTRTTEECIKDRFLPLTVSGGDIWSPEKFFALTQCNPSVCELTEGQAFSLISSQISRDFQILFSVQDRVLEIEGGWGGLRIVLRPGPAVARVFSLGVQIYGEIECSLDLDYDYLISTELLKARFLYDFTGYVPFRPINTYEGARLAVDQNKSATSEKKRKPKRSSLGFAPMLTIPLSGPKMVLSLMEVILNQNACSKMGSVYRSFHAASIPSLIDVMRTARGFRLCCDLYAISIRVSASFSSRVTCLIHASLSEMYVRVGHYSVNVSIVYGDDRASGTSDYAAYKPINPLNKPHLLPRDLSEKMPPVVLSRDLLFLKHRLAPSAFIDCHLHVSRGITVSPLSVQQVLSSELQDNSWDDGDALSSHSVMLTRPTYRRIWFNWNDWEDCADQFDYFEEGWGWTELPALAILRYLRQEAIDRNLISEDEVPRILASDVRQEGKDPEAEVSIRDVLD